MKIDDYTNVAESLLAEANAIEVSKRPGYTGGSEDVLANFKRIAERLHMTPEQVWAVYFAKHTDAIMTAMTQPTLPVSEALLGRFADAINYLKLGWGLVVEKEQWKTGQEPAAKASLLTSKEQMMKLAASLTGAAGDRPLAWKP
jgi:hypothetical protein